MKSIFKKTFILLIFISTISFSIITVYFINIKSSIPSLDLSLLNKKTMSTIYDVNGNKLDFQNSFIQENITYDQISKNMIHAIISIEDRNFFSHDGINYKRLAGAMFENASSMSFKQGASTITQQLIKNVYLSNEKTVTRKVKEYLYALTLEKHMSKEEIITCYLNNILFGGNVYGIKMASITYFNKLPSDLSVNESAFLAGMIQAPNKYNPYKNIDDCNERKNIVLKSMLECEFIEQSDYNKLKNKSIKSTLIDKKENEITYLSSAINYTNNKVNEMGYNLYLDNMTVYTTFDINISKKIYNVINQNEILKNNDQMLYGIALLDNNTRSITALFGNKDYQIGNLDYSFMVKRQPGSTIKPLLDYAPAIEYLNYNPLTILNDEPITYQNGDSVKNYDNNFKGEMTLREALKDSRNTTAIKVFNAVGYDKAFEFASKLGIHKEANIYESNAIGGFSYGYSVLDMTNAYMTFANMGEYTNAIGIKKIKLNDLSINTMQTSKQVMKESTAFLINDILHDVLKNGNYYPDNIYLSAKTGQTNFSAEQIEKYHFNRSFVKDSWVIGYTKNYTLGIWIGFEDINEKTYISGQAIHLAKVLLRNIFNTLDDKYETYKVPSNLCLMQLDCVNGKMYLKGDYIYGKTYYDYVFKNQIPYEYYNPFEDQI